MSSKFVARIADRLAHARGSEIAGCAVVLAVAAWVVAPMLVGPGLPPDFPAPPDAKLVNASAGELIRRTDEEARQRPQSAEAIGKLGMVYHANLLFDQAAAAYRIAARLAPDAYQWAYAQAALHEETGAEDEQLTFLQKTVELKPDHVPALIKLADSSFKRNRLDDAARHYEKVGRTAAGPAALQGAFGAGRVAARRGHWNQIIETVTPAAKAYPDAGPLYGLLEEAYKALGQPDQASKARQSAASAKWKTLPPVDDPFRDQLMDLSFASTSLLKHAGLLSRTGHPDRAIELARRAAAAEPADADVRNYLARTLITFYGDKPNAVDEAMTHLEHCLRLRPSDPAPLGGFADDFFQTPKPPAAVERLRTMLRARPEIPGVHYFLGQAADALGEREQAAAEYRAALQANPNDSGAHNKLGLIAESSGRYDEASAHFRKAIVLNPMNTAARLNLAIELMQQSKYEQGFKQLEELLRINPHDAEAHFCMGFAFLSMRRVDDAAAKFQEGLRYKPDDSEARFGLGAALAAQGRREEAAAELREAVRLRPDHARARQLLSQLAN